jgi:hypothetical protein
MKIYGAFLFLVQLDWNTLGQARIAPMSRKMPVPTKLSDFAYNPVSINSIILISVPKTL